MICFIEIIKRRKVIILVPILNLTRSVLPARSNLAYQNLGHVKNMPEMVLANLVRKGNKKIVHVGMNQTKGVQILPDKVHTIYTDALASCNSVGIIMKGKDGNPVAILSHFTPSAASNELQASSIKNHIETLNPLIDRTNKPKVFYNVPGYESEEGLKPCVNNIFGKIREVLDKFFNKNYEEQIIPYKTKNRPPFYSSANIFQFDTKNPNKLKMTAVGEQEHLIDLNF